MMEKLRIKYFTEISSERKNNQDNFYILGIANWLSESTLFGEMSTDMKSPRVLAVFDGMGGESAGEKASLMAATCMEQFSQDINNMSTKHDVTNALETYYSLFMRKMDDVVDDEYAVCGTTCAGIVIEQRQMIPFWLGDSRVYVLRKGKLDRVTTDHSLAQIKIDNGFMTEEDARNTEIWHTLSAYMGQCGAVFSVGDSIEIQRGDKIFICSDGITDLCLDKELEQILCCEGRKIMERLSKLAETRGSDNCTAILIDIVDESVFGLGKKVIKEVGRCLRL